MVERWRETDLSAYAPAPGMTLRPTMRVFLNATALSIVRGADVHAAVRALDPELLRRVVDGTAYVTDARGIAVAPDAPLAEGSILRVVVSARTPQSAKTSRQWA